MENFGQRSSDEVVLGDITVFGWLAGVKSAVQRFQRDMCTSIDQQASFMARLEGELQRAWDTAVGAKQQADGLAQEVQQLKEQRQADQAKSSQLEHNMKALAAAVDVLKSASADQEAGNACEELAKLAGDIRKLQGDVANIEELIDEDRGKSTDEDNLIEEQQRNCVMGPQPNVTEKVRQSNASWDS